MRVLGQVLRNNAPLMILSNATPWYFLRYHQHYSFEYATHANHVSTPPILPTLAYHLRHPRWNVNHASTSRTLTCHPRQHATNANTPPTLAGLQRKHALTTPTLAQKACHFSNSWVSNQLSDSKRKSSSFYFQFLFVQSLLVRPS